MTETLKDFASMKSESYIFFDKIKGLDWIQQKVLDEYVEQFATAVEMKLPDPEIPEEVSLLYTFMVPLVLPFGLENPEFIVFELLFHESKSVDVQYLNVNDLRESIKQEPNENFTPEMQEALTVQVTKALLQTHPCSVMSKVGFEDLHCGISYRVCETNPEGNLDPKGRQYVLGAIMLQKRKFYRFHYLNQIESQFY